MEPEQRTLWLEVLDQLHSRLQKIALLGLALLMAVTSGVFFKLDRLWVERLRIRPQLENLGSPSTAEQIQLEKEIQEALKHTDCLVASAAQTKRIKIGCIPSLSNGSLSSALASDSKWNLWGLELPLPLFGLIVFFAPITLLLGTLITGIQLRKLHSLLRSEVSCISVQQKLNSLYFARVTTTYGERWGLQILLAAVSNLVPALVVSMYPYITRFYENVIGVVVSDGKITFFDFTDKVVDVPKSLIISWSVVFWSAIALCLVVIVIFARLVTTRNTR